MIKSYVKNLVNVSLIFLTFTLVLNSQLFSQNGSNNQTESWTTSKKGGVCFRVTGNHPMDKYSEYAALFSEKDKNFSFTIGLGLTEVGVEGYAAGILQMQLAGNELLDPTPNFRTNYFRTIFNPIAYENLPGVDHIIGNKICLKFDEVDESKRIKEGYLDIINDRIFGEHEFEGFGGDNTFLYFPSINTLVKIDELVDNDVYSILDVWDESINLGRKIDVLYYLFSVRDISLTDESMILLGNESIKLADYYNIQRPYSWIQPGGNFPNMSADKVKNTMGNQLSYLSGEVYSSNISLMTYNEYDQLGDRRYSMLWGNFREDEWTIEESKAVIADFVAKNRVAISKSYLGTRPDDSGDYLFKTAVLLDWCKIKDIPITTHSQWAKILYDNKQNPYINIFPELNVDLDENGFPDGYAMDDPVFIGTIDKLDGAPQIENYSMKVVGQTGICRISGLGGIEKGENSFEIYTKGSTGNFITVTFTLGNKTKQFKFPAEISNWTKYDLSLSINENKSLFIPDSISLIDIAIRCSDYSSGEVKISGMTLSSSKIDDIPPSTPQNLEGMSLDKDASIFWSKNFEDDIQSYSLYRSTDPQFDPDTLLNPIFSNTDTFHVDYDVEVGQTYYYRVSASDFAGNMSEYSSPVSVFIITDVDKHAQSPMQFELFQNFPNPFNPTTKITFTLPQKSNVSLAVYNTIGQMVTELVNSDLSAGTHTVNFDASGFSSGLYFFRISAGDFVAARKMILLK